MTHGRMIYIETPGNTLKTEDIKLDEFSIKSKKFHIQTISGIQRYRQYNSVTVYYSLYQCTEHTHCKYIVLDRPSHSLRPFCVWY